jgi:hypothetical protein
MTPETIRKRIEAIRAVKHDPERAHCMQDDLLSEVLGAIASGGCSPSPEACAAAALEVEAVDFERWYA